MNAIEIRNLYKKYKEHVLYEDASLTVGEGHTVGIIGANGTGKSVLFRLIAGLEYADGGEILVRGKAVGKDQDFPENIGIFVNQPGYIEFYDGFTNLKLLAEVRHVISDQQIRDCMRRLGLNPDDHTKVKNYSAGMKQKLGIAQAVMENQTIILLDEPFNALDFQTNAEIFSILKQLKEEKKTILLTSHQQDFLEKVCDELYIILNKKLVPFTEEIRRSYFSLFGNGT